MDLDVDEGVDVGVGEGVDVGRGVVVDNGRVRGGLWGAKDF